MGTGPGKHAAGGAGLTLGLVSAAAFGTSGTFAAALIGAGWSPGAAVLARMAVAALILTVPAVLRLRGQWALLRRSAGRVAAYGLFAVAAAQWCYFNAVARIPVGVAILLEYLGVVLVVGWLWLRHGQRPRRLTIIGGVAALAGLVMVLNLAGSAGINPAGVFWALGGAVGLATFFVLSAGDEQEPLPPLVMTWAGMCVGTATLAAMAGTGLLPLTATVADVHVFGHQVSWIVPVLGLSLVAAVISYIAGIGAARRLGARLASFIGMAEVLFAILFAWLLLGQLPTPVQFVGGGFILAGVAMVRLGELQAPRRPPVPRNCGRTRVGWPTRRPPDADPGGVQRPARASSSSACRSLAACSAQAPVSTTTSTATASRQDPRARRRAEQGGHPAGHRPGPGHRDPAGARPDHAEGGRGPPGRGGHHGHPADGDGHQAAVAGDPGSMLVGPALHRVVHRAGERHKDRVGRGGQVRHRGEQVVPAREVGTLVREQRRAAGLVECLKQAAGDHDPARPAGQCVCLDGGAADDHDGAVVVQARGAPVGLGQGAGAVPERDRDGHRGHGQHQGGHRAGDGGGGIGAVHHALGVVPQRGQRRYAGGEGGRKQR